MESANQHQFYQIRLRQSQYILQFFHICDKLVVLIAIKVDDDD